ncbi:hypothetical protein ACHAQC_001539 [Fusarium culmorum]
MSTFNGIVSEFPEIRIDFFRRNADAQPPLACFLSHVHSDHLAGLESLRSPFVYCSAATREILLRLERYPCRINYGKGVLEARQQTFKHLSKVLKSLPLETPTSIELCPGREIQVTLFDANHCPGAVMFLVEGDGKAILYTGDIRSEPWFVNAIERNPNLIEYTSGLKTLDKIYLDTSFTEDVPFQTKAQGITELLKKISKYPKDTVFHFQAWTYGYEDVWIALSKALKSKIHVDDYKLRIYGSLKSRNPRSQFDVDVHLTPESPALTGHMCGNTPHPGCLTSDINVCLHSCERGNICEVASKDTTVLIQPIIAHLSEGKDLAEVGVGGGGDDFKQEAELEFVDQANLAALSDVALSSSATSSQKSDMLREGLEQLVSTGRNIPLDWDIDTLSTNSAKEVIAILVQKLRKNIKNQKSVHEEALPKTIYFPYSRHSSLLELRHFVEAFRPRDIWPCTVNTAEWLRNGTTIGSLFGQFCSSKEFEHDRVMQAIAAKNALCSQNQQHASQTTVDSDPAPSSPNQEPQDSQEQRSGNFEPVFASLLVDTQVSGYQEETNLNPEKPADLNTLPENLSARSASDGPIEQSEGIPQDLDTAPEAPAGNVSDARTHPSSTRKRGISNVSQNVPEDEYRETANTSGKPCRLGIPEDYPLACQEAYWQMIRNIEGDTPWTPLQLISTSSEYNCVEKEL